MLDARYLHIGDLQYWDESCACYILHLREIYAFDAAGNEIQAINATMSSSQTNHEVNLYECKSCLISDIFWQASRCIDGNLTTFCHSQTADNEGIDPDPWLRIEYDLGVQISRVVVYNRDPDEYRMVRIKDATISIMDSNVVLWEDTFKDTQTVYEFDVESVEGTATPYDIWCICFYFESL